MQFPVSAVSQLSLDYAAVCDTGIPLSVQRPIHPKVSWGKKASSKCKITLMVENDTVLLCVMRKGEGEKKEARQTT